MARPKKNQTTATKVIAAFERERLKLKGLTPKILLAIARDVLTLSREYVPVDTGRLFKSGRVAIRKSGVISEVVLSYNTPYAKIVEEGRHLGSNDHNRRIPRIMNLINGRRNNTSKSSSPRKVLKGKKYAQNGKRGPWFVKRALSDPRFASNIAQWIRVELQEGGK